MLSTSVEPPEDTFCLLFSRCAPRMMVLKHLPKARGVALQVKSAKVHKETRQLCPAYTAYSSHAQAQLIRLQADQLTLRM